ncbi:MAG: DUF4145 domain-containing protein [Nanoarchaeota archaeon]|nr:DUF4145 domain-containing protein [Nanoarchaeota archaeon]MBU4116627.1 DUF4145 domain-containing protein [Nanoarchaeota archaeon]
MTFQKPETKANSFTCPHCGVHAMQNWSDLMTQFDGRGGWIRQKDMIVGLCDHCSKITIWLNDEMLFPSKPSVPTSNEDLEEDIKKDYNEAAEIVEKSPKSAAALLRLAIQKLCKQLGEKGENINNDIGELVKKGLPAKIQKSLDIVRVVGNESVHPGQINLDDNKETAYKLFDLINLIANTMITQPKEIDNLYNNLPTEKLKSITERDK